MLPEFVLFIQSLGLQLGPDDLKRVCYGGCQHTRDHASDCFAYISKAIHPSLLEFLIKHVVKTSKSSLLYAAGQTSTK